MNILRDSQLAFFLSQHNFYNLLLQSLGGFLFKFLQSSRLQKPEVVLDFCINAVCPPRRFTSSRRSRVRFSLSRQATLANFEAAR